jgi:hypothetical protein
MPLSISFDCAFCFCFTYCQPFDQQQYVFAITIWLKINVRQMLVRLACIVSSTRFSVTTWMNLLQKKLKLAVRTQVNKSMCMVQRMITQHGLHLT